MRVAVVGSREFSDLELVKRYIDRDILPHDIVISGGARGVDETAERWHKGRGGMVRVIRPDWNKHGKAAGPIRNRQIVDEADRVVAFWDGKSRGTRSSIDEALAQGKQLVVIFAGQD